jgi:hypothetical protein
MLNVRQCHDLSLRNSALSLPDRELPEVDQGTTARGIRQISRRFSGFKANDLTLADVIEF